MSARLVGIEIAGFRGFPVPQTIPLDADVIVVSGGNGTGKTSLTDAIVWCLTGDLPSIRDRLKGERKTDDADFITSKYATEPASVTLTIKTDDGLATATRRGTAFETELTATRAGRRLPDAAAALSEIFDFDGSASLESAIRSWGVLRQDSLRATLDGSADLHVRLREILGLSILAEFEAATAKTAKELGAVADDARTALDRVRSQIAAAEGRVAAARERRTAHEERRRDVPAVLDRLGAGPVRVSLPSSVQLADIAEAGTEVTKLRDHAVAVAALGPTRERPSLDAANAELERARTVVSRAMQRVAEEEERATTEVRLWEAALHLLGDECPVCLQDIDEAQVRESLRTRQSGTTAELVARRDNLAHAREALERAASARDATAREHLARQSATLQWQQAIADAKAVQLPSEWRAPEHAEAAADALSAVRLELQAVYRALAAADGDPLIAQGTSQLADLRAQESKLLGALENAASQARIADELRRAAPAAAVEITRDRLSSLEPAFAEVYDRLAPHPSFTELGMIHDTFYGKGRSSPRIRDPLRDIEAHPAVVFSEGQYNIVALSYFLALNLETERGGLPFAVLDDPLQAMDVANVLGFADIVRALRTRRQVLITTHDKRFASLLVRKLTPRHAARKTLHLEFVAWSRSGPSVRVHAGELETIPSLLGAA